MTTTKKQICFQKPLPGAMAELGDQFREVKGTLPQQLHLAALPPAGAAGCHRNVANPGLTKGFWFHTGS